MSRSRPRLRWTPRRTAWLCLACVSVIAGLISYYHGMMVVSASDGGWLARWIVDHAEPALADLVITGSSANLLDAYRNLAEGEKLPKLSMVTAGIGCAVTIYFNVAAGHPAWVPTWVVNGWPPIAFGLALESLLGLVRRGAGGPEADDDGQDQAPTTEDALRVLLSTGSMRALAAELGVDKYRVETWSARVRAASAVANGNGSGGA